MIPRSNPGSPLGRELARLVGPGGFVLSGPADLLAYSYDATGKQSLPQAVVFPAGTEDAASVVRWAAGRSIPVIARGAGTNLSGGTVPVHGGIVLELSRLKRVIATDLPGRRAVVQPGMTNLALQQYLAPLGYTFAPDPASQKVSTLGGNVAENAGGPHCLKYGVTADHILGLTAITASGEIARLGYGPGSDMALDAVSLLVGSEGTLAVFTEIVVRLEPLPPAVKTLLAVYDRLEDAGRTVSEIIGRRMLPATLELMDRTTMLTVEESFHLGYPTDAEGALIIEVDGLEAGLSRQVAQIEEVCRACGARSVSAAKDAAERDRLWLGRRSAFGALARRSPIYSVQDATVPRDRMVEMMRAVEEITRRHGLETAIVAHAGDGNFHPIILYREATPERMARVESANEEMLSLAVAMGGTISGEHGVGLEKLRHMPLAVPPGALRAMARVKRAFDPESGLNPGKALPPAGLEDSPEPLHATQPGERRTAPQTTSSATLIDQIRQAASGGCLIIPTGRGSRQAWRPSRSGRALSTAGHAGLVELDGANLTASVRAGTPSRGLADELASAGFWLPPLDHFWDGTVGGDAATDVLSPTRAALGGMRRWVLGAEFIDSRGDVIRAGGKTMKNVAGYDLVRPLIGSHGRLGLITELTFRLWPMPEADLTLHCHLREAAIDPTDLTQAVLATRPAAVAVVGPVSGLGNSAAQSSGEHSALLVRLTGLREDVDWAAAYWLSSLPALKPAPPAEAASLWATWAGPLRVAAGSGRLLRFEVPAQRALLFTIDVLARPQSATAVVAGATAYAMCLISGQGQASACRLPSLDETSCDIAALHAAVAERGGAAFDYGGSPGKWPSSPLDGLVLRAFDPGGVWGGGGERA